MRYFLIFGQMTALVEKRKKVIERICREHSVQELFLFGSALTAEFNEESDLDFAVIFKENLTPLEYGDVFLRLLDDLKELFHRNIDLVSYRVIKNPIFKEELDKTKISLYAAA